MELRPDRLNKTLFFLSSGLVDTAIWIHYIDANQTYGKKVWRQLHKNAANFIEEILEAATNKKRQLYGHLPPIMKTIQVRRTSHAGHC